MLSLPMQNVMKRYLSLLVASLVLLACGAASAADIDLSVWRSIPVFEAKNNSGRVEPLDSFARQSMDDICNQAKGAIKLSLKDYVNADEDVANSVYKDALPLFPEGKERKFEPAELLLSWLAEPERWETVPFIYAAHKDVREILGVPERNDRGLHLKYVSPKQVFESEKFREYLRDLHEREQVEGFKASPIDQLVYELRNRYDRFRALTLDPTQPLTAGLVAAPGGRREFLQQLNGIIASVEKPNAEDKTLLMLLEVLAKLPDAQDSKRGGPITLPQAAGQTYVALGEVLDVGQKLFGQWRTDVEGALEPGDYDTSIQLDGVAASVSQLRTAVSELETQLVKQRDRLLNKATSEERQMLGPLFREMTDKVRDLNVRVTELNVALYEDGNCVRVIPALNPGALSKKRDPSVKSQPWYSLTAVVASEELMADYPAASVKEVRAAWKVLKEAFADRDNADRPQQVKQAQLRLYEALHTLGDEVEPLREKMVEDKLPADERDAAIMAYTRWPNEAGLKRIDAELRYNRVDPFGRSWVISLIALACFSLSFGALRKPMYIAAVAVLCLGILWTAYGFYLRVYVTQWAPVTNMYETVVWVAFSVAILGAWFLLLPLIWNGIKDAWRATAIPASFEAKALDKWQLQKMSSGAWFITNCAMLLLRMALTVGVFYALAIDTRYSDGQRTIFSLWPNLSDAGGNLGEVVQQIIVWAVGFICMLLSVWFTPRLTLTFLGSVIFIPWDLMQRRGPELARLGSEVRQRWPIGVGATLMSAFGAWVTWMAPSVLDESFSPLQPVLRSNFWLTVHVLTIVSSYAAGMLALGIGLIALGYYIFGTYRDPIVPTQVPEGFRPAGQDDDNDAQRLSRRPPEEIGPLAQYAYRAIQVAVLLLATGTILGGIWADRSWGRFWGWDPKEVWALVSLLIYLAILHGRFAGWFNNFGLIFGTVIGATAIVMSWYGVNFVLPKLAPDGMVGLHSYGSGAGGLPQVMSFIAALWIYQFAALIAYGRAMSTTATPIAVAPSAMSANEVSLPRVHQAKSWTTSAGMMLGLGAFVLFTVLSAAYVATLIYAGGYSLRGAMSMVLPIPAAGVLVYVIAAGVLNSLGIETQKRGPIEQQPEKPEPATVH